MDAQLLICWPTARGTLALNPGGPAEQRQCYSCKQPVWWSPDTDAIDGVTIAWCIDCAIIDAPGPVSQACAALLARHDARLN